MKVSFLAFFAAWAEERQWVVPDLHLKMCHWLETCQDPERVLLVFRGAAKSTLLAIYNAWKIAGDRSVRILAQSADDKNAYKLSRDTISVLRRHPMTRFLVSGDFAVEQWWIQGNEDARNPSMYAKGIMSNITSSRADIIQNDDVEVPKNIRTAEARETLRTRLSEQTHIQTPEAQFTYVGTPHTHESLYTELAQSGASVLKIPLFSEHLRLENPSMRVEVPFKALKDGYYVFSGIGRYAKCLTEGRDYTAKDGWIVFDRSYQGIVDIYAGNAWPERFTRAEMAKRRRQTRTLNEWDSQYQLDARPQHDIRLDPDRLVVYDVEPQISVANGEVQMILGVQPLVGVTTYWDCALGRVGGDVSAFSIVFTDPRGRLYWHVCEELIGDLEVLDADGALTGGQCKQVRDLVLKYHLPGVNVETNGLGGFVPQILRKHLNGTGCAVREVVRPSTISKTRVILDALEAPLSSRFLWAHHSVYSGPLYQEMKDWQPDVQNQPDNFLDSGAGAIKETPVRVGKIIGVPLESSHRPFRRANTTQEIVFER